MGKKTDSKKLFELHEFPQPEIWPLRYPVLLCHGFGALASLFNPSPLHETAMILRSHGIQAYAPNIVPYATIEVRAGAWGKVIAKLLKQLPEKKIHIVAHSMAGLDIRYALHRLQFHDNVASLITFCSPHHGSPLADLAMKAPEFFQKIFISISNYLGSKSYPDVHSDARGALLQLSPEHVIHKFNKTCPVTETVPLYSITSSCGVGTSTPIGKALKTFNRYIYDIEGENDGFVSRKSAAFGEVLFHTDLSHHEQIRLVLGKNGEERWKNTWKQIYQKLREIEQQ